MRIEEIKKLIELVEQSGIGELEVRHWWSSIRILKNPRGDAQVVSLAAPSPSLPQGTSPAADRRQPADPDASFEADVARGALAVIASPMVGTFYVASSSTAEPYVKVGSHVSAGQVVCIVEAMKLMNEIEAEVSGTIAKVLVENGQPVEFNQALFHVRPD